MDSDGLEEMGQGCQQLFADSYGERSTETYRAAAEIFKLIVLRDFKNTSP